MTPNRLLAPLAMFALAAAAPAPSTPAPSFNREAWKADFEKIKQGLAQGYANLDWQVDRRGINLARADGQITATLDKANSDVEAALVLVKLVDAFHDPHLQLQIGPPPAGATLLPLQSSVDQPSPASSACGGSRYSNGKSATRLAYPQAQDWQPLAESPFQSGLIDDVGFIRVPAFGEERYLSACQRVARPGMDARALQLATRAELNREIRALIDTLRSRGMKKLVIDVTNNGGGSEWSNQLAAMLAKGFLRRRAPMLANPSCDRSAVWRGERACPIYAKEPEVETMEGTAAWTGPLAVFADRRSASATEEFITWLKDNKRAVVAGERTFGAGCGYVDGGYAIALTAAPLHIMVPNCSRYTGEGLNEIEGIAPDVPVDWAVVEAKDFAPLLARLFPS